MCGFDQLGFRGVDTRTRSCIMDPKVNKPDNVTSSSKSPVSYSTIFLRFRALHGRGAMRDEEE